MLKSPAVVAILLMLSVAACGQRTQQEEVAALLVNQTPASRAELVAAIAAALKGAPVSIADNVLTQSSRVAFEHSDPANSPNRAATGRTLGTGEWFQLVTTGSVCILIHETGSTRTELLRADCVPE
jgi:hypothetical protein